MIKNTKKLFILGSLLLGTTLYAQEKTVTGRVTDPDGLAVPFALVKNPQGVEVFTDNDGQFTIQANVGDLITIESFGLPTQVFNVGSDHHYTVAIRPTSELSVGEQIQLNDVVITALGIEKRTDALTNAQQIVGAAELTQASSPTAIQSLIGKVSGLQIRTTNTSVNPSYRFVLRGERSITSNNQALVVIDNVISSSSILQQLPPEAIESINVVKGPQGAALYGEQGVNGVVIVTTKRGNKREHLQFTFTSSADFSEVFKLPIVQKKYGKGLRDPSAWSDFDYDGTNYVPWENTSWGPAYDHPRIRGTMVPSGLPQANGKFIYEPYEPVKNHFKKFFRSGWIFQNGLNLSVGGSDSYAFLSVNRQEHQFVVIGDEMKLNSFLFKGGKKINKFRIDANINYNSRSISNTTSALYGSLLYTPTNNNIKKYRYSGVEGHLTAYARNPYWTIEHERFGNRSEYFSGILSLEYEVSPHFNITYTGNISTRGIKSESHFDGAVFTEVYDAPGTSIDGLLFSEIAGGDYTSWYSRSTSNSRNYYGDLMLNFNYDLSERINLKANVGNNIQDNLYDITSVSGDDLRTPGWYHINNILSPDPFYALNNNSTRSRKISWFTNLDLAYENYLFLNATYRVEQNSILSLRDQFTNNLSNKAYHYYSGGVSFVPTKAFDIKSDTFSYSKIAFSYTRVGNASAIAPYALTQIGVFPTGYPFGDLSSYIQSTSPTSNTIGNEFMTTIDFNMILGFFKNRINLETSLYQTTTEDLITHSTTSSASGLSRVQDNIGEMRLRGMELDLNITPVKTAQFNWDFKAGYSSSVSKVMDLEEGTDEVALLSYSNPSVGIFAIRNQSFPMIKGTKFIRDPQNRIVVGSNGNPLTTTSLEILGRTTPRYVLNFSTTLRFKDLRLAAVMDYRHGGQFVSFTKRTLAFSGSLVESADFDRSQGYIIPNSVQNIGTDANPVYVTNTTPVGSSATYEGVENYFASNAYMSVGENLVVDGTAFKMREITLSYDIPKAILKEGTIKAITLGAYARNPFFIYAKDNKNYADPETASSSGNSAGIALTGQYPSIRSFGLNLKASF